MAGQIYKSLNVNIFKFLSKQVHRSSIINRHIYGNNYLMIDGYLESKEKTAIQFRGMKEKFIEKIGQYSKDDSSSMIFTEDLKHMIHLVENKDEEINLLVLMIKKYNKQNAELRFSTFTFGPVIMRCLHHFEAVDVIYSLITDKNLENFFDQLLTYIIAMDILWKKEKYEKVLEVFEIVKKRQIKGIKFPKDAIVLYLAACYKMNTIESLNLARTLIKEASEANAIILRKAATFAILLSINQNAPEMAMELLSVIQNVNYFTVKNLKIVTLAKLGRISECFEILKTCLDRDLPQHSNIAQGQQICEETLKILRSEIDRQDSNKSDLATLDRLEKCLKEENLISMESLDSCMCSPTLVRPPPRVDSSVHGYASKFYRRSDSKRFQETSRSRQGLINSD